MNTQKRPEVDINGASAVPGGALPNPSTVTAWIWASSPVDGTDPTVRMEVEATDTKVLVLPQVGEQI